MLTEATSVACDKRSETILSAITRKSREGRLPLMARYIIGADDVSRLATTGLLAWVGNCCRTASTFARMSFADASTFVPMYNWHRIVETPCCDVELISFMPLTPEMLSSIGFVISVSMSCGFLPG